MVLVDYQIERLVRLGLVEHGELGRGERRFLRPGITSTGYIAKLSDDAVCSCASGELVDPLSQFHIHPTRRVRPKRKRGKGAGCAAAEIILVEPGDVLFARSEERVLLPADVSAQVFGLEPYTKCGAFVSPAVLEPGFAGHVCFQIANVGKATIALHIGLGIIFLTFDRVERPQEVALDTGGKDVSAPRVKAVNKQPSNWAGRREW